MNTAYKDGSHPKFEEKPSKGQNKTISMFLHDTACPLNQQFPEISWNLIKIAIFKEIMAIVNLEMIKRYMNLC